MAANTRRDFLRSGAILFGSSLIPFDGILFPGNKELPVRKHIVKTIDMIPFLKPYPKYTDEKQWHTTGYGRYNYPDRPDLPPRVEGGFMKVAQILPKEGQFVYDNEVARYILQKGPSHPCEYSIIMKEQDNDGNDLLVSYLKTEVMDWEGNMSSRSYPRNNNHPTFEWGRSNALPNGLNMQYPPFNEWDYCGIDAPKNEILNPSGYIVKGPYDLEGNLDVIDQDLGTLGSRHPLVPRDETRNQLIAWRDLVYSLGLKKPKLLTIGGYWCADRDMPINEWNAWNRERYDYLSGENDEGVPCGTGHVGWHWQERIDGNLRNDFVTLQEGISTTVVPEDKPILPLMPCDVPAELHVSLATADNIHLFAAMGRYRWQKQPMNYSAR